MEITAYFADGDKTALEASSVRINREYGVPADDAEIKVPWEGEIPDISSISIALDGKTVFAGPIDVIEKSDSAGGGQIRIETRSPAALLLDNEACPAVYEGATAGLIFENHIRPFGLKAVYSKDKRLEGTFRISKGMSEWQVVADFCRRCFNSFPYCAPDGSVYFEPPQGEETDLSQFVSMTESRRRCKMISGVYIKSAGSVGYSTFIQSEQARKAAVRAVRYLDASQSGSLPMSAAEEMIRLGEEESYVLELTVPGCVMPFPGAAARTGGKTGLFVSRVKYSCSEGESTVIQLKRLTIKSPQGNQNTQKAFSDQDQ